MEGSFGRWLGVRDGYCGFCTGFSAQKIGVRGSEQGEVLLVGFGGFEPHIVDESILFVSSVGLPVDIPPLVLLL